MRLGHEGGVTFVPFPQAEPSLLVEETVTCVIQIKGKVRDRVEVPADHRRGRAAVAGAGPREGGRAPRPTGSGRSSCGRRGW